MGFEIKATVYFYLFILQSVTCDHSQLDCQTNEVFVECGRCEGTCSIPKPRSCTEECQFPRCECALKNGFVRALDGACIKLSECSTYKGSTYFVEGDKNNLKMGTVPSIKPNSFTSSDTNYDQLNDGSVQQSQVPLDSEDVKAIKSGAMGNLEYEETEAFEESAKRSKGKFGVHTPDFYGFLVQRRSHRQ